MKIPDFIKHTLILLSLFMGIVYFNACTEEYSTGPFYEDESRSIADYIITQEDSFARFQEIMVAGEVDKTLKAYNPHGNNYTLFLPTDAAFDRFISNNEDFGDFQELLNDTLYVRELSRYHVLNMAMDKNEFPFGALPDTTLSGDLLTMGISGGLDSTVLKINKYASIIRPNIEVSNGYIHVIDEVLKPITYNSYEWLKQQPEYSIFAKALDTTGLSNIYRANTLLVEPNDVFRKIGVTSFEDLANRYSPLDQNYTDYNNHLYQFVAYHILRGKHLLENYEGVDDNYNTYGSSPVSIDGKGLDIKINEGVEVFDTLINEDDTTIIDYIGIDYDNSNETTTNGVIHFIDNVLEMFKPTARPRTFQFYEDPEIQDASQISQTITFDDTSGFELINWHGEEEIDYHISSPDDIDDIWNNYLEIEGEFTITYEFPKVLPSQYLFKIMADGDASVQIYLDGEKMGESLDLSEIGSEIDVGEVDFSNYTEHQIKIESTVAGRFRWFGARFIPDEN